MQVAAFSVRCPYEIGDKVQVLTAAEKNGDGVLYRTTSATITDIACTHYLRTGKVLFTYELDGSGKYVQMITGNEASPVQ